MYFGISNNKEMSLERKNLPIVCFVFLVTLTLFLIHPMISYADSETTVVYVPGYHGPAYNQDEYMVFDPVTGTYVNFYDGPKSGPGYYDQMPYGPGYDGSNTSGSSSSYGYGISGQSRWVQVANNGYMYYYANGTYAHDNFDQIDGIWYYFDSNGLMHRGWLYRNGYWYYMLPNGSMATSSWNNINESWYYFNAAGIMQTGYIILDGNVYYADSSGSRVQSGYNPDGHLFDANGVMVL